MNIKKVGFIAGCIIVGLIVLKILLNLFIPFLIIAVIVAVFGYAFWKLWEFLSKDKDVQGAVGEAKTFTKKIVDFINEKIKK